MKEAAKQFLLEWWPWIMDESNNRGVMLIVTAVGVLVTMTGILVGILMKRRSLASPSPTHPPLGGEVWTSIEDFQAALERGQREVEKRLAQVHGDERTRLENESREIRRQLSDIGAAHAHALTKIREMEEALIRLSVDFGDGRLAEARAAMEAGDFSKANALLAEIESGADVAVVRAAEAAFQRGEIAALQIKWDEAATHYDKSARLNPTHDHLNEAGVFAQRTARYRAALQHFEKSLEFSRQMHGDKSSETATALNNLAGLLEDTGRYEEAEPLYRQALEVGGEVLGEKHPDYASGLNNLAGLLRTTGRHHEAERLYRHALEIDQESLDGKHPYYATRLNNLAGLLEDTGRYEEAEPLYRQALKIDRETLGEKHPDYATRLNNLAGLLRTTGRHEEAKTLYRQALEVDREALGERHPDYATDVNNLAGLLEDTGQYEEAEPLYRQALEILRTTLGDDHPSSKRVARNYARLLRVHFPESPALGELKSAFGEDIGHGLAHS